MAVIALHGPQKASGAAESAQVGDGGTMQQLLHFASVAAAFLPQSIRDALDLGPLTSADLVDDGDMAGYVNSALAELQAAGQDVPDIRVKGPQAGVAWLLALATLVQMQAAKNPKPPPLIKGPSEMEWAALYQEVASGLPMISQLRPLVEAVAMKQWLRKQVGAQFEAGVVPGA